MIEIGKFISSFTKIFKINTFNRLKYLTAHHFDEFSKVYPRHIRNAIAHQDFRIDANGGVYIRDESLKISDLESNIRDIAKVIDICSAGLASDW